MLFFSLTIMQLDLMSTAAAKIDLQINVNNKKRFSLYVSDAGKIRICINSPKSKKKF